MISYVHLEHSQYEWCLSLYKMVTQRAMALFVCLEAGTYLCNVRQDEV